MPYIKIKAYPKDEDTKKRVADRINQVFLEEWGCPQGAISLSFEEISPDLWQSEVAEKEIIPNQDKMHIFSGEKKY